MRYVYKYSEDQKFVIGSDIKKHLENCGGFILFAATLGAEIDLKIRGLEALDISKAYDYDVWASGKLERQKSAAELEIKKKFPKKFLTRAFSPGYGDYPIELNCDICDFLQTQKTIGVSATENFLLVPRKSITAVIGVSDSPAQGKFAACATCVIREKCGYGKEKLCNA
jgi:5-methyltetrahydrofolate--homocysteine methyltransferase